jgi:hypothetical protein
MKVTIDVEILAAICKKFGKTAAGGYELFIHRSEVGSISRTGQVDHVPNPEGIKLLYRPNLTIEGTFIRVEEPIESPPELKEPEEKG